MVVQYVSSKWLTVKVTSQSLFVVVELFYAGALPPLFIEMSQILRTKNHGCWKLVNSKYWGRYLRPIDDPEGQDIELNELTQFELIPDFPRLPADLMLHIISLMKKFSIEVQVILARSETDNRQWRVFVPKQSNTGASVNAYDTLDLVDIVTGEKFTSGIPLGWVQAGTSHLHPNMHAFWSGVDDASELVGSPGLHFTIGGMNWLNTTDYTICASICLEGTRHVYHPSVLIEVDAYKPEVVTASAPANLEIGQTNGAVTWNWLPKVKTSAIGKDEYYVKNDKLVEIPEAVLGQITLTRFNGVGYGRNYGYSYGHWAQNAKPFTQKTPTSQAKTKQKKPRKHSYFLDNRHDFDFNNYDYGYGDEYGWAEAYLTAYYDKKHGHTDKKEAGAISVRGLSAIDEIRNQIEDYLVCSGDIGDLLNLFQDYEEQILGEVIDEVLDEI